MTTVGMPICMECTHLNKDRRGVFSCAAFPDGIPTAIVESRFDHQQPMEGDHGIRFTPRYPDRVGAYTRNPLLVRKKSA